MRLRKQRKIRHGNVERERRQIKLQENMDNSIWERIKREREKERKKDRERTKERERWKANRILQLMHKRFGRKCKQWLARID